ncbi:MAG: hypothetical protein EBZ48_13150 [Proteobacteria bacterium]|nr:hypothetical protein [Pseudomonadota bacterium]
MLRVIPNVDSQEASIGFYRRADEQDLSLGDSWVLGSNSFGVGVGNFSVGTRVVGSCLSIASSGVINAPFGIQINGNDLIQSNQVAVQMTLSGGGLVTWTGSYLKWTDRILALPSERTELALEGFHEMHCPTSGTVVLYQDPGLSGSTVSCTTNGINLPMFTALYYEISKTRTSSQSQFRVVNYNNYAWHPTGNWLLIAINNFDYGLKWMPGLVHIPKRTIPATFDTISGQCSWLRPWVAFEYSNTGPTINNFGQNTIATSSISNSGGNYLITIPSHPSGTNYGIMVTTRASGACTANYSGTKSATQFRIYTYNSAGVVTDQDFFVQTVP